MGVDFMDQILVTYSDNRTTYTANKFLKKAFCHLLNKAVDKRHIFINY